MNFKSTYRFLRPTLLVLACYCLALFTSRLVFDRSDDETQQIEELSSTIESIENPRPNLEAGEVVRLQLAGLMNKNHARGIVQCMAFASPDNLAVTGPLERFGRMVRSEKFRVLAHPDRLLVGQATIVDGKARILVTLVHGRELRSFVWVLSKQDAAPFEGCWMTDAVFPLDFRERGEISVVLTEDVV